MSEVKTIRPHPNPLVSVIIPSLDGRRGGNVEKLLDDLERQTMQEFEILMPIGIKPNGKARNEGVRKAKGRYLVCIDDDVRLGHERVIENLLVPLLDVERSGHDWTQPGNGHIGMTGPSQQLPPDATRFQRWAAKQLPRTQFPIVDDYIDTDMVTHMCLCIPTDLYKAVGWENEHIVRGTDVDLRYRVRQFGYRIVVVPRTWAYHPVPATLQGVLREWFNKGRWTAFNRKQFPGFDYEAPDGVLPNGKYVPKRSKTYRVLRFAGRFLLGVVTFQPVRLLAQVVYAVGYLRGQFFETRYEP
ncbi:hypothetical protein HRbin17_00545 [bacterium HR17]|uniref:Glycosyltransferase 2-like domain-containing protein n=1 Tax=Candidatus Fervidibacter japonicus TaxID=2035412 RepID=A0A2H5XA32_9BACT|nr:hypothetical protein HRbin17_00545 [bacterium HR17]